jgi:Family of unknown function (DUF5996)
MATRHIDWSTQAEAWPALRVDDWANTRETLHMWAQVVGKVRLAKAPSANVGCLLQPRVPSVPASYEAARAAAEEPDVAVLQFLRDTYHAAALGRWDRPALETEPHRWAEKGGSAGEVR